MATPAPTFNSDAITDLMASGVTITWNSLGSTFTYNAWCWAPDPVDPPVSATSSSAELLSVIQFRQQNFSYFNGDTAGLESVNIFPLSASTQYMFAIRGYNHTTGVHSEFSAISFTTLPSPVPTFPSDAITNLTSSSATISWNSLGSMFHYAAWCWAPLPSDPPVSETASSAELESAIVAQGSTFSFYNTSITDVSANISPL